MKNLKIGWRLMIISGVALASCLLLTAALLMTLSGALLEDRQEKTKNLVETAHGLLAHYAELEATGALGRAEAQAAAKAALRALRYGEDDYFWIHDTDARILMHAQKPELEGRSLIGLEDQNGKQFFREMVDLVRTDGAGFVYYFWPKPGSARPVEKVSYVRGFAPWAWTVGTGIYIDDVDAIFRDKLLLAAGIVIPALFLIAGVCLVVARGITRPLTKMTETMTRMSHGELEVVVPGTDRRDELGEMAGAVQVFKDNAIERQRLEAEQAAEREAQLARAKRLEDLTGAFDGEVAAVLSALGGSAGEMESTSQAMSATAEETSRQASAVAAASDQASSNVQTVAAAAEELSSSIREIARQMGESSSIARDAAGEAEKTQATVRGLAAAAEKIGEVVDLINAIAGQTNLLALNATIEAARAQEPGAARRLLPEVDTACGDVLAALDRLSTEVAAAEGAKPRAAA